MTVGELILRLLLVPKHLPVIVYSPSEFDVIAGHLEVEECEVRDLQEVDHEVTGLRIR